jgi:hypothetical protein
MKYYHKFTCKIILINSLPLRELFNKPYNYVCVSQVLLYIFVASKLLVIIHPAKTNFGNTMKYYHKFTCKIILINSLPLRELFNKPFKSSLRLRTHNYVCVSQVLLYIFVASKLLVIIHPAKTSFANTMKYYHKFTCKIILIS